MADLPSLIGLDQRGFMADLARRSPARGAIVEVGVYQGGSAQSLYKVAQERKATLWLYDTFTGIPYADPQIDSHKVGDFSDVNIDKLKAEMPKAKFRPGIFPKTLDRRMGKVSFVHLDVDQYQSYRDAITALLPLLLPEAVMVFDDYGILGSANKAVDELLGRRRIIHGKHRYYYIHRREWPPEPAHAPLTFPTMMDRSRHAAEITRGGLVVGYRQDDFIFDPNGAFNRMAEVG